MGYYTGNGVYISKSATAVCNGTALVAGYYITDPDGTQHPKNQHLEVNSGVCIQTVLRKSGVPEPSITTANASITMGGNLYSPHETASTSTTATRIGDSNLWEVTITTRTTSNQTTTA